MNKDLRSINERGNVLRAAENGSVRGARGDRGCGTSRNASSRSGFTLIELLIVAVLMSVLMLGVWTMFRTWSRLYTQGQTKATRLQLIRSLCDQFTDDLRAAHQPPPIRRRQEPVAAGGPPLPPPPPDDASNNGPTFMGGSDWLLVEVIQPANPWQMPQETDSTSLNATQYGLGTDEPAALVAPELQLVLYSFLPPKSDPLDSLSATVDELSAADDVETIVSGEDEEEAQQVSGLQRLTIAQEYLGAWSAAVGQRAESSAIKGPRDAIFWIREQVSGLGEESDSLATPSGSMVGLESQASSDTDLLASVLERDDVPEIAWLEFRYFDGSSWRTSWESESIGRLPVAVEMRFELVEEKKAPVRPNRDDDTELVDETPVNQGGLDQVSSNLAPDTRTDERDLRGEAGEKTAPTYRRCVIYLNPPDQGSGQRRPGGGSGSSESGGPPSSEPN